MTAQLIDSEVIATNLRQQIARRATERHQRGLRVPGLAVILANTGLVFQVYVAYKRKDCKEVGFLSQAYDLLAETSQNDLLTLIDRLNDDPAVNGTLVQLPLPTHLDASLLLECIHPDKDVDGSHPYNIDRLAQRMPLLRPCIPGGIITLLASTGADSYSMDAVAVGVSSIVGRPAALELLLGGCAVTVTHCSTRGLADHVPRTDLAVAAAGKPGLVKDEQVKEGVTVIDVGINRQAGGRLVDDVEYEAAAQRVSWIIPVPGGVRPMTCACPLESTLHAVGHLYNWGRRQ